MPKRAAKLHYRFRTLDEAEELARRIAGLYPDPQMVYYGLHELMINAVEHGNLGIGYDRKTELVREGAWRREVERRLALKKNAKKYADVVVENTGSKSRVRIRDNGDGFDWRPYLEISLDGITTPHGRGIATACILSFASVKYLGKGNEVLCTVDLKKI